MASEVFDYDCSVTKTTDDDDHASNYADVATEPPHLPPPPGQAPAKLKVAG